MNTYDLILKRRTVRKFTREPISDELLTKMINAARLAPSAANLQPLRYIAIKSPELCDTVFSLTKYAGYLKDGAPREGERPTAYIVVLTDVNVRRESGLDEGAAIENIILTALEEGIASCWVGSVSRNELAQVLKLPDNLVIGSVVALGYPAQESCEAPFDGDVKYYLDESGKLHVPKRALDDIMEIR